MNLVPLEIVTPDRMVYEGQMHMLIAKTESGDIGILPGHSPLMGTLKPSVVKVINEEGTFYLAVAGGFLEVQPSRVTLLADAAELGSEIDAKRAEEAVARAEQRLQDATGGAEHERARKALLRAQVRLAAASAAAEIDNAPRR